MRVALEIVPTVKQASSAEDLSSLVNRPMAKRWEFAPSVPIALKYRYP